MHGQSAECANIRAMPRWKDDEDRGEFGAWLSAQVGERTFDWLAAEMAQRGYAHRPDYYRAMAGGSKPPGRIIGRALREFFGGGPEEPRRSPGDPVAAAIDRQTEVLRLLVEETRLSRVAQETTAQAVAEMVGRLDRFLDFAGTPNGGGQPSAVGTR